MPASVGVPGGIFRLSMAATLVGLDLPSASSNVEIKPYGISRLTTDRCAHGHPHERSRRPTAGIDVKYGVTANLTADVTVNTDFAQVEVDEQQVNLTRFTLSSPKSATSSSRAAASSISAAPLTRPAAGTRRPRMIAVALLQPAHRPEREPRHPDRSSAAGSPARSASSASAS